MINYVSIAYTFISITITLTIVILIECNYDELNSYIIEYNDHRASNHMEIVISFTTNSEFSSPLGTRTL